MTKDVARRDKKYYNEKLLSILNVDAQALFASQRVMGLITC